MGNSYDLDDDLLDEEKYLFLILYAPGNSGKFNEGVRGNTWLQKEIFLLEKIIPKIRLRFDEHHFGAYSPTLDMLTKQNIISELIEQNGENKGRLRLTEEGIRTAQKLWNDIPVEEKEAITRVKNFMNDMDQWELIDYSYATFPETTVNSDVLDQFRKTRLDAACSLFQRKKISVEKGASIAGITLDSFLNELKKRNISAFSLNNENFKKSIDYLENIIRR